MRLLIPALIIIFAALQYKLWVETDGLKQTWQLRDAIARQNQLNLKLVDRNKALEAEVEDLKHGHAAIEERARTELGMVRQGETFYQIIGNDAASKPQPDDE